MKRQTVVMVAGIIGGLAGGAVAVTTLTDPFGSYFITKNAVQQGIVIGLSVFGGSAIAEEMTVAGYEAHDYVKSRREQRRMRIANTKPTNPDIPEEA